MSTFDVNVDENMKEAYKYVTCPELKKRTLELKRYFDKAPFVPDDKKERDARCLTSVFGTEALTPYIDIWSPL